MMVNQPKRLSKPFATWQVPLILVLDIKMRHLATTWMVFAPVVPILNP